MNNDKPMPTGAINVALCFSAASMKMVKTSSAVRNISMKRPRVTEVPILSAVRTSSGPGNSTLTTAAAEMAPSICDTVRSTPRIYGSAPHDTHSQRHSRIEEPSRDAKEYPGIDS